MFYAKKIKNLFFSILAIFLFFLLSELILSLTYKITKSTYFETGNEYTQRLVFLEKFYPEDSLNFYNDLKSKYAKIAVFGGSSAAGYGSPINFTEFLLTIDSSIIIHNYALNGQPFVGFQSELLKKVLPYYDYIIIYAGHNEFWGHLYQKAFSTNKIIYFPNNVFGQQKIKQNDLIFSDKESRLNKLNKILLKNKKKNYILSITANSRLFNFYKKLLLKTQKFTNYFIKKDNETLIPFYLDEPILTVDDKRTIVAEFKKEIELIQKLMRPNQKLIISTVLSNDLFPPISDHLQNKDLEKIEILNKKTKIIYEQIIKNSSNVFYFFTKNAKNKNLESTKIYNELKYFRNGAHKSYLDGINCIENHKSLENYQNCLEILKDARNNDSINLRILPELNTFIRSINNQYKNIYIIDPEKKIEQQNNTRYYLSLFIGLSVFIYLYKWIRAWLVNQIFENVQTVII
jgi:hypothetical protein